MSCRLFKRTNDFHCIHPENVNQNICECFGVKLKEDKVVCKHCEKENPFNIISCGVGGCPLGADC